MSHYSGSYTPNSAQLLSPYSPPPQFSYPQRPQLQAPQPRHAIPMISITHESLAEGYTPSIHSGGHRRARSEAKGGWVGSPSHYVERHVKTASPPHSNSLRIETNHGHRRSTSEFSPLSPLPPNTTPPPSPYMTSTELYPSPSGNRSFSAAQDSPYAYRGHGRSPSSASSTSSDGLEGASREERIAAIDKLLGECLAISGTLRTVSKLHYHAPS